MLRLERCPLESLLVPRASEGLSLEVEDRSFLHVQYGRHHDTAWRACFDRLGASAPTSSCWSSVDDALFVWDRPGAFIACCSAETRQYWFDFFTAAPPGTEEPAVSLFDGLLMLKLRGSAVSSFLSSSCGYDFTRRSQAQAMTTRLGDIRVILLLDAVQNNERETCVVMDRSYLDYVNERISGYQYVRNHE